MATQHRDVGAVLCDSVAFGIAEWATRYVASDAAGVPHEGRGRAGRAGTGTGDTRNGIPMVTSTRRRRSGDIPDGGCMANGRDHVHARMSSPMRFAAIGSLACALLVGCSASSNNGVLANGDGGASPASNLPEASAKDLGKSCSGYGTSIGDTAAFPTDDCPAEAGMCVVDARNGLKSFCSVDCSKYRCPSGWVCQVTSVGKRSACFPDGNSAQEDDTKDAAAPSGDPVLDAKLPGYRPNSSTRTPIALREFQDATRAKRDLVVLIFGTAWDFYTGPLIDDPEVLGIPRAQMINVLVQGTKPGEAPTSSNIVVWRQQHPKIAMLIDDNAKTLGTFLSRTDAWPLVVALDAATLEKVGEQVGGQRVPDAVEGWRAKVKE